MNLDLKETVGYIAEKSRELKDKYTNEPNAPIEFACIFCQNDAEYEEYSRQIKPLGKSVQDTSTGYTYLLEEPVKTKSGPLRLVKVRKPDPQRKEKGDADFNTDYRKLKETYLGKPNFELIVQGDFEMMRIFDTDFDVMTCFYNTPLSKILGISLGSC